MNEIVCSMCLCACVIWYCLRPENAPEKTGDEVKESESAPDAIKGKGAEEQEDGET